MKNDNECGCGCHSHHGSPKDSHHSKGCCHSSGHVQRRFVSKDEMINQLQEYLQQLKLEIKGVEEHLGQLKTGK